MNIAPAIIHLFPQANPMMDFVVRDDSDGNGAYIAQWNLEEPEPTEEELQAAWESLNTVSLEQYKSIKIDLLSGLRDEELTAGFTSTVKRNSINLNFSYSEKAQQRFMKQLAIIVANPDINAINWLTTNGGFVVLDRTEFISITNSGADHEITIEFKFLYAQANIMNAVDKTEVDTIVDGW
jgi:hypothetical protein